jgi:hypothetical protein
LPRARARILLARSAPPRRGFCAAGPEQHVSALIGFFSRRWRGEVALPRLLWRDMFGVGTFINVLASVGALVLLAQRVDGRLAVALHFAPLAYNLFLLMAVWRCAQRTALTSAMALAWFVVMAVV